MRHQREKYIGIKFQPVFCGSFLPTKEELAKIKKLIYIGKKIGTLGIKDKNGGNLSFRTKDGLVIKRTGVLPFQLKVKDFVKVIKVVGSNVFVLGQHEPSSESRLHWLIYQARKDVNYIFHCHDFSAVYHREKFSDVGYLPAFSYGTMALAKAVEDKAKYYDYLILKNHGVIALSQNPEMALMLLQEMMKNLEKLAKKLPKTIEFENGQLKIIDQRFLPKKLKIVNLKNYQQVIEAIKKMKIRGAEAIGAAAAGGIFLAAQKYSGKKLSGMKKFLQQVAGKIKKTRPTAINLAWGLRQILSGLKADSVSALQEKIKQRYELFLRSETEDNFQIGKYGNQLIKNGARILTHCNAGSLSSIWFGTGLAPIFAAHLAGKKIKVLIDETRPWLQGSRLTAWEMARVGIKYQIQIDSAAEYLMSHKMVDLVLVGADRIAANGDTANKIGTYPLAVLAQRHHIPFYVAADSASIDFKTKTGQNIKIEERDDAEILKAISYRGERISPEKAKGFNPVFDVTPAKLITEIITEYGIFKPTQLKILEKQLEKSL
jgi:methylthioribose-1-phosphate isomerase